MADHRKWCLKVDPALCDNIKFKRLKAGIRKITNIENLHEFLTLGIIVKLWQSAIVNFPDGTLSGLSVEDIGELIGLDGDSARKIIPLMEDCGKSEFKPSGAGLIVKTESGYEITDWKLWQGDILKKREEWRERWRETRGKRYTEKESAPGISSPQDQVAHRLTMLSRKLPVTGSMDSIRRWIEGHVKQGHGAKLEAILSNSNDSGKSWNDLEAMYFKSQEKSAFEKAAERFVGEGEEV